MTSDELKQAIEDKGLKQKWIAEKLNISEGLVSQWVKGSTPIPKKHVPKLKILIYASFK